MKVARPLRPTGAMGEKLRSSAAGRNGKVPVARCDRSRHTQTRAMGEKLRSSAAGRNGRVPIARCDRSRHTQAYGGGFGGPDCGLSCRPMGGLAIGITYELFGSYPRRERDPADFEAEYEPEATLHVIEAALRRLGHRPLRLGRPRDLLVAAGGAVTAGGGLGVDAALSIAEGYGPRNREAWAPVLLEMLEIPRIGSDALTLSLSLDKAWTRLLVAAGGVPVAPAFVASSEAELGDRELPLPAFVKPRWEGSAKGIDAASRADDRAALARAVRRVTEGYGQPALVEAFLPGPEYTVCVVGNDPPRALPVLQRALDRATGIGHHALPPEERGVAEVAGDLSAEFEERLSAHALTAYRVLDCLDFARVDFKLDATGTPHFLEINPLPSFDPEGSFGIAAELAGIPPAALLADILGAALARLGLGPGPSTPPRPPRSDGASGAR